jgi:hypothetical protein
MDIPDEVAEISIGLAKDRLVATLKEMPDLLVLSVVILAVGG